MSREAKQDKIHSGKTKKVEKQKEKSMQTKKKERKKKEMSREKAKQAKYIAGRKVERKTRQNGIAGKRRS